MRLLEVQELNVYYGGIHAVRDISFYVDEGEIVTLIGANGAGKSTILGAVAGILRGKGSILWDGGSRNISGISPHRTLPLGLALVPEGRAVFQEMTVRENLEMGAFTCPKDKLAERLERAYAEFPRLKERERQLAGTMSGGEQQMLAIGRAIMSNPRLLMLDEPSMGLAPILVEQIFDIIQNLHKGGTTILLVEQNAQTALSVADRGYVLETGHIVKTAPAKELLDDDDIRKAYLGHA